VQRSSNNVLLKCSAHEGPLGTWYSVLGIGGLVAGAKKGCQIETTEDEYEDDDEDES
jgi:hypothetical protein